MRTEIKIGEAAISRLLMFTWLTIGSERSLNVIGSDKTAIQRIMLSQPEPRAFCVNLREKMKQMLDGGGGVPGTSGNVLNH